jgi:3-hydroxyacyl-[acyl-carrier-protein] dehydratase
MRWFWIDRYVEFESGVHAVAIKAVTLAEEHLHDHFPGFPVMPNSLILEGLAQTGGLLVSQQHDFLRNVVLAKVVRAKFLLPALPGDTLRYRAKIENVNKEAASVTLTSHIDDRLQAEAEVFFAYVDDIADGQTLLPREQFLAWLRILRVFEVGRYPDGRRLTSENFPEAAAHLEETASLAVNGVASPTVASPKAPSPAGEVR